MNFINSYKHLEKLCGEVMNDRRSISAYIDEMERTPRGAFYVSSWNDDLKSLKHYRWVRNQIAHEPDCDEQNMCDPSDALWLDDFYFRIMNQTDPLALYHKATTPTNAHKRNQPTSTSDTKADVQKSTTGRYVLLLAALLIILFIAVFFFYLR